MPDEKENADTPASALIDARIAALDDWRGAMLARVRALIHAADSGMEETVKWRKPTNPNGVPVWEHDGIVCTGETYKDKVKIIFAQGAALPDPKGVFNASLEGNARRAIDLYEGDSINAQAFKALVRAAVKLNAEKAAGKGKKKGKPAKDRSDDKNVVLLSGGNPKIAKADGDAPVQAYIAAMPGWKRDVGAQLDALVVRTVPKVRKAVRWNTPFYGIEGQDWFLAFHCFTKYIKVTLLNGSELDPLPPIASKHETTRYYHINEGEALDVKLLARWIRQAAKLPGEALF